MAVVSVLPSFLVPSSTAHYLSFASACLAWTAASLLHRVPALGRVPAGLLLVSVFLFTAADVRAQHDRNRSLHVPTPRKAELCRLLVGDLRNAGPPSKLRGLQVFKGLPLDDWDLYYGNIFVEGDPEPAESFACRVDWTVSESGVRRLTEAGETQ